MGISKKHLIAGAVGNIAVFISAFLGVLILLIEPGDKSTILQYFTVLSNILVGILSLINFFAFLYAASKEKDSIPEGLQVAKLIGVSCVLLTFLTVVFFLAPSNPSFGWFSGSQLFLHLLTPLIAAFSFIFLEYAPKIRFRFFFLPALIVFAYGLFYVLYAFNAPIGTHVDWYGFMFQPGYRVAPVDASKFTGGLFALFLLGSLGGSAVIGLLLWALNKIIHLIFIGYDLDEAEEEPKQKEAMKASTKTSSPKKYKDGARVYHISRSKFVSKSWQVKLANGDKAIKTFPTQLEAINYAKGLVKTQGGSIRIHSMKGRMRK